MSKTRNAIRWYNDMAMLSHDEQLSAGHPEIDVEHLFLALLSIGGPVTDALAAQGVTLRKARDTFAQLHTRRLEALGIRLTQTGEERRRIPDAASPTLVFKPGVEKMLVQASKKPRPDVALFGALLREPAGHITEVLHCLDVDPTSLTFEEPDARDSGEQLDGGDELIVIEYRHFLPAPPDEVWAIIGDPDRFLEWNDLEYEHAETIGSGIIRARTRQRKTNGKPARVKPEFATVDHVISRYERPSLLQWERSFPDGYSQSLRIVLHAEGAGTKAALAMIVPRLSRNRKSLLLRPVSIALRPLIRAMTRSQLRAKAHNISRALRRD